MKDHFELKIGFYVVSQHSIKDPKSIKLLTKKLHRFAPRIIKMTNDKDENIMSEK